MTGWTPNVSQSTIIGVGLVQGAGLGFLFVPLSAATLSTLPTESRTSRNLEELLPFTGHLKSRERLNRLALGPSMR
jgi:hypothetical protein